MAFRNGGENTGLARIAATCLAIFALASVAAAVGYAEWMWPFVFAGLVLSPIVLFVAVGVALINRLSRAR